MASLSSLYIKTETLETLLQTAKKKELKGVELTISINDEANQYDQNVTSYVSQSKEDREAQKKRFYTGNGRTFWTDGKISVPVKTDAQQAAANNSDDDDDLPW